MMNGTKKSDSAMVPAKPANKAERSTAELVEGKTLRKAQAELAHVTRVTMLGELTASIAHEVNQPLAGVIGNAEACLRWLDRGTPDLDAVRRSVQRVVDHGYRASEMIRRVRALAKKSDMETVRLDLNQVVNEAVTPVEREVIKHEVCGHLIDASKNMRRNCKAKGLSFLRLTTSWWADWQIGQFLPRQL
jgi:C4-dicarboxylate-specific signal transduction histidine kinase